MEIDNRSSGVYFFIADAYLKKEQFDTALQYLDKGLTIEPANSEARAMKGWALYKLGKRDEASRILKRTIEMNERCSTAHYYLALIYEDGKDFEAALYELKKAQMYENLPVNIDKINKDIQRIKEKINDEK